MNETPMVAVVNCDLLDDGGAPATVLRPMDDAELAQWKLDQAAAPAEAAPDAPVTARGIAAILKRLPQDQPVTAGELLAAIQGDN